MSGCTVDVETYSIFLIRVLGFEPRLSYTVVNAVVLLQFVLTMQNMPVFSADQTNDFAGVLCSLSPTSFSFSSASELFVTSSCLRLEPFHSFVSCCPVLSRHIKKVAPEYTVRLYHW